MYLITSLNHMLLFHVFLKKELLLICLLLLILEKILETQFLPIDTSGSVTRARGVKPNFNFLKYYL